MYTKEPNNESVTKIERVNGKWQQTLLEENVPYGTALLMVAHLRVFMNKLIAAGEISESRRTYYRLGRTH